MASIKLLLRNVYRLLRSRVSWSVQLVLLDIGAREVLNWWLSSLYGWNGNILVKSPDIQIVTGASPSGYGTAFLGKQALGFWTPFIVNMPQNAHEMMAT